MEIGTLTSYVPWIIARRLAHDPTPITEPIARKFSAAVLFADISGFTALTERLAQRGPAGAEELTQLLNQYFGQLVELITAHGGDVIKFAGDSLYTIWEAAPAELVTATRRAAQCGLAIQAKLNDYQVTDGLRLGMKIGIGVGEVLTLDVGGMLDRWESLMAGAPLVQMGQAEKQAKPGDVVLSAEAFALVAPFAEKGVEANGAEAKRAPLERGCVRLAALRAQLAPTPLPPLALPATTAIQTALLAYVPGAIRSRLAAGQTEWLAELRPVTVLFVNVRGIDYGALDVLERVQAVKHAMQRILYHYEGSVNKLLVDDKGTNLIVALGLPPLAHVDDPTRAVRTACEMRAKLEELGLEASIGVATGQVFCGPVGSDVRREYTVIGDTVNLAARLMQAAAGRVLCDSATAQAAMAHHVFEELPPLMLKGKEKPVSVYTPCGQAQPSARPILRHLAIVGRAKERTLVADELRALMTGAGSVVVIEGEAGMGKSQIVTDLLERARELGVTSLVGTGDAIEKSTPYHAWHAVFQQLFDFDAIPEGREIRRCRVLGRLQPDARLAPLAPLLNQVLPLELPDNEATAQLVGQIRANTTLELLASLLEKEAHEGPLLLVLEDTQWLDSQAWALAALVRQRVAPLLLVIATRPMGAAAPPELAQLAAGARKIVLGRLSDDEGLELVRQRLSVSKLPDALSKLIREKAHGNPFFCEELAYALRDAGLIDVVDGECVLSAEAGDLSSIEFPDTIQGVITSRIDRLDPSEQLALKVSSVIGRSFPYRILHDIYPFDDDRGRLRERLSGLEKLDLLPLEAEHESSYVFSHTMTQEVAYNLMLYSQRRQLHRAVAEWYEDRHPESLSLLYPLLAHHWSRTFTIHNLDPVPVNKAIDYLQKAGEQAMISFANREAVEFFDQALALLAHLPETPERLQRELVLQATKGLPLITIKGYAAPEVQQTFERARALCDQFGEVPQLAPILHGLWAFYVVRCDFAGAHQMGDELYSIAQHENDRGLLLEARTSQGLNYFWTDDLVMARALFTEALSIYDPVAHRSHALEYFQDPAVVSHVHMSMILQVQGYPDQALEHSQAAIALAERQKHPYSLAYALGFASTFHQLRREPDMIRKRADAAIALASEYGFPIWVAMGTINKFWAQAQSHEPGVAADTIAHVAGLWGGMGARLWSTYQLADLAEAQACAGRLEPALASIDEAIRRSGELGETTFHVAEYKRIRGDVLWARGDQPGAEASFREAVQLARKKSAKSWELRASVRLARLYIAQGRDEAARSALNAVFDWFDEGFDTPDLVDARGLLAESGPGEVLSTTA